MIPIDYRQETWDSLQGRINADRRAVLNAWRFHGPGTTREVAQRSGIDLLTFRPRTTDLHQLGFVVIDETAQPRRGHEGTYRALRDEEVLAEFSARCRAARTSAECQPELKLTPATA